MTYKLYPDIKSSSIPTSASAFLYYDYTLVSHLSYLHYFYILVSFIIAAYIFNKSTVGLK